LCIRAWCFETTSSSKASSLRILSQGRSPSNRFNIRMWAQIFALVGERQPSARRCRVARPLGARLARGMWRSWPRRGLHSGHRPQPPLRPAAAPSLCMMPCAWPKGKALRGMRLVLHRQKKIQSHERSRWDTGRGNGCVEIRATCASRNEAHENIDAVLEFLAQATQGAQI
jgi:hypothetical protein